MADTDEDLQTKVDDAVAADASETADNANEDTSAGDTQENDDTSSSDDGSTTDNTSQADAGGSASDSEDDTDEEDEDEDDDLDPFTQPGAAGKQSENFDIRTLPRDANGLIDPEEANKQIQAYADQRAAAQISGVQTEAKAREVLTNQWMKAKDKYPFLSQNKDLAGLTRDLHLNSIVAAQNGTGRYMSPLAAAKKVNKMYSRAVRSGVAQQRTKQHVEHSASTERSSGKSEGVDKSEYEKAKEMALSKDPAMARQGRQKVMSLRYAARHRG